MPNTKITSKVIADANILTAAIADNAVTGDKVADDVALAGNPTTTTQTAGNNTTRVATTAFVSTAVSNLVASAPSALDTLNELAAAMGDDANFSTTVTNSIATKLPLSGGTLTGNIAHAGNFSLDVAGDLTLDAGGGDIILSDDGTIVGTISMNNNSGDLHIRSRVQDKDLVFQGNDNGSEITALTLDMSEAGQATFSDDINLGDGKRLRMGAGGDFEIFHDGSHNYIKGATGDQDLIFQGVDGSSAITALTLDMSDGGTAKFNHNIKAVTDDGFISSGASDDLIMFHDGTDSKIFNSTGDMIIDSADSDKDLIFKGKDGSSVITALTLDMSAAGKALFNSGANFGTSIGTPSGDGLIQILGGASGSGNFSALTLQHHNTTTTNDGSSLEFEGRYNTNPWNFARIKTYNNGSGFGANMDFDIHPADGNQNPSLVTAMTIRGDGGSAALVGIGTTTPDEHVTIDGRSDVRGILNIRSQSAGTTYNGGTIAFKGYHASASDGTRTWFEIRGLKENTTGGSVTGRIEMYLNPGNNTMTEVFKIESNGDTYTNDGTVHSLASDSRVKSDVADLTDGLTILNQLRPVTYKYNTKSEFYNPIDETTTRYGFIADEVKTVAPQYIKEGEGKVDGVEVDDFKTLSQTKMIPMLVKAIQEQQTIMEDLKARIETLEG